MCPSTPTCGWYFSSPAYRRKTTTVARRRCANVSASAWAARHFVNAFSSVNPESRCLTLSKFVCYSDPVPSASAPIV